VATEQGTVVRGGFQTAWVRTERTRACEGCQAKSSCLAMGGGTEMEVEALNEAEARVGDRVLLEFGTGSLLKATFLLYVFPILLLLAGAFAGRAASPFLGWGETAGAATAGFLLFFAGLLLVRIQGNRMARRREYRPRIVRVTGRACRPKGGGDPEAESEKARAKAKGRGEGE